MSQKILDALQKLDANNDNHWTIDGQAKLDTVKFFASEQSLTREQLNTIAPGFNRESYRAYLINKPTETVNAPANGAESGAGTGTVEPASATSGSESGETEIEALAEKIAVEDETILELQRFQDENGKKLKEAQQRRDTLSAQYDKLIPPETNQDVIQKYLERQKEILRQRGEMIGAIRATGVNLEVLAKMTSKSPLDVRMKNRRRSHA
jgi:hypothetical protein